MATPGSWYDILDVTRAAPSPKALASALGPRPTRPPAGGGGAAPPWWQDQPRPIGDPRPVTPPVQPPPLGGAGASTTPTPSLPPSSQNQDEGNGGQIGDTFTNPSYVDMGGQPGTAHNDIAQWLGSLIDGEPAAGTAAVAGGASVEPVSNRGTGAGGFFDRAGNWIGERVQNAANNPIRTGLDFALGFIPGVGWINTASSLLGGPTLGGGITAAGRALGEALSTPTNTAAAAPAPPAPVAPVPPVTLPQHVPATTQNPPPRPAGTPGNWLYSDIARRWQPPDWEWWMGAPPAPPQQLAQVGASDVGGGASEDQFADRVLPDNWSLNAELPTYEQMIDQVLSQAGHYQAPPTFEPADIAGTQPAPAPGQFDISVPDLAALLSDPAPADDQGVSYDSAQADQGHGMDWDSGGSDYYSESFGDNQSGDDGWYHSGGRVRGKVRGKVEDVPATLQEGEGVLTRAAMRRYPGLMQAANKGKLDARALARAL